jgi:hypothetical protein
MCALLPSHRTPQPTFQPIVVNEPLTDEERARLTVWRNAYPLIEWVTTKQLHRLEFERWRWRNGDEA